MVEMASDQAVPLLTSFQGLSPTHFRLYMALCFCVFWCVRL